MTRQHRNAARNLIQSFSISAVDSPLFDELAHGCYCAQVYLQQTAPSVELADTALFRITTQIFSMESNPSYYASVGKGERELSRLYALEGALRDYIEAPVIAA